MVNLQEVILCASVLDDPKVYPKVRYVRRDWFDSADYRRLWVGVSWVLDQTPDLDADTLTTEVRNLLLARAYVEEANIVTMLRTAYAGTAALADTAAQALREAVTMEDLKSLVFRLGTVVGSEGETLAGKRGLMRSMFQEVMDQADGEGELDPSVMRLDSFMARGPSDPYDWVIPGLLERQERFMLIAPEKAGKSVLSRQVALMLSVGLHPFDEDERVPVMRTLIVDLENPNAILRRDFARQTLDLGDMWINENENAWVMHRPAGIHLGDPRDEDALNQAVSMLRPDLVVISPIYKAYDDLEKSWEEQAFGVQKPLDRLRERFGCALWMEHHSPWGEKGKPREIRPFGSSRWARWLDYQAMLVPDDDNDAHTVRWRSVQRDERKLSPRALMRGGFGHPSWVPQWWDDERGDGFRLALDRATSH